PDDLRAPSARYRSALRQLDSRKVPCPVASRLDSHTACADQRPGRRFDLKPKCSRSDGFQPTRRECELRVAAGAVVDGVGGGVVGREGPGRVDARELVGELAKALSEEVLEIVRRAARVLLVDAALSLGKQSQLRAVERCGIAEADGNQLREGELR